MNDLRRRLAAEVGKVVVGQGSTVDALLAALLVGGHVLLEGVPGVAKTLVARAFAQATGLEFARVQFTPDMLPADITGTVVLRGTDLQFSPGPIFTNVLLADEINRTPPKTQAALLEAMGEGQVTVYAETHRLPELFLVVATQNPIEYEGTYALPEAQLDRFLMKVDVGYPTSEEEVTLLQLSRRGIKPITLEQVGTVTDGDELAVERHAVDGVSVAGEVVRYVSELVRVTRTLPAVEVGASPRAGVHLLSVARVTARMAGRDFVTPDDVAAVAPLVLRHRLVLRPEAEIERYRPDDAVQAALSAVPVPR